MLRPVSFALFCVAISSLSLACRGDGRAPPPKVPPDSAAAAPAPSTPAASATAPPPAPVAPPGTAELTPVPESIGRSVTLVKVISGLRRPVLVTAAPGEPGKLYVVEQLGAIRVFDGSAVRKERFFDLVGGVSTGNEQGLLGLAFHPRYAENRKLYVYYTDRQGDTRIVEYLAKPDRTAVDPATARELLHVDQPYANHNGGHLTFGPDGKLYTGLGDGGAAGDPLGAGQDKTTLLGKLLRIDVDSQAPRADIVHWGLRNPWRFAFDSKTGDLFIGDVGQNKWEYVHALGGDDTRSHNFGWNILEGSHCYGARTCDRTGKTPPVVEYSHDSGCSITGGVVYRGKALPVLDGAYFYADYCTSIVRSFRFTRDRTDTAGASGKVPGYVRDHWDWRAAIDRRRELSQLSSFGTDSDGEVYLVSLTGTVWRFAPAP